ncbi:MAG: dihydropteroate synthase [Dehalococcoidia bacterium]
MLRPLRFGRYDFPGGRTLVMGVLNVTPDSFSDGGRYFDARKAIEQARAMVAEGADILDIGGESTRPGAEPVPADEELRRVLPVIEAVVSDLDVPVSIDTVKPEVAERCLSAGAVILNDVQGLRDTAMIDAAARHGASVVIMHMKGTPRTMNQEAVYTDLLAEVRGFLVAQAGKARAAGIETVVIDPGLGFAKNTEHNLAILNHVDTFTSTGYPVLIGPSRKRFIGELTGKDADARVPGTLAAVTAAVLSGAAIVRVHDVAAGKQAVQVAEGIRNA